MRPVTALSLLIFLTSFPMICRSSGEQRSDSDEKPKHICSGQNGGPCGHVVDPCADSADGCEHPLINPDNIKKYEEDKVRESKAA